jgi:hypothetical protein
MGRWDIEQWHWKLEWRRIFFSRELEPFRLLMELMHSVPLKFEEDSWSFIIGGDFTVRAIYSLLYNKFVLPPSFGPSSFDITNVWANWAPSKVIVFSWQTLLGPLPMRSNLAHRGVIVAEEELACVCCSGFVESEDHLFASCPLASWIWYKIHRWFCLSFVVPSSISSIFKSFLVPYRRGKVGLKGVLLVWHAAIWVLWHARNDRIRHKNYIDLYASSNISLHSEVNEIFLGGKLNITD